MTLTWLKETPKKFRQVGMLAGWLAGILLLGSLLWFFVLPVRNRVLAGTVNRLLRTSGSEVRLGTALPLWGRAGRAGLLGTWYSLQNSGGRAVVFPVMNGGMQASFLGLVSPEGRVETLIPLGNNAAKIAARLPPGILGFYAKRVETGGALFQSRRGL